MGDWCNAVAIFVSIFILISVIVCYLLFLYSPQKYIIFCYAVCFFTILFSYCCIFLSLVILAYHYLYLILSHSAYNLFMVSAQCFLCLNTALLSSQCKRFVGRKPWESRLTPTVLRVHNGRYEHEHRPFSMLITVGVRQLSQGFRPILGMF